MPINSMKAGHPVCFFIFCMFCISLWQPKQTKTGEVPAQMSKGLGAAVREARRGAKQKGGVATVANSIVPGLSYRSVATWFLTVCFHRKSPEARTSDFSRKAGNLGF